jgi:histidine ammonia-lyase
MHLLSSFDVTLSTLRKAYEGVTSVALSDTDKVLIEKSRQTIADIIASDCTVYGVNTGFGMLANTGIADDQLAALQRNIVLSHSVGVGRPLEDNVVRLAMCLKVLGLARGHSGVRIELVEALNAMLKAGIYPIIPSKGSVGASGDLAPLAAMASALMGLGDVRVRGKVMPATKALKSAHITPVILGPKEGLALLNGTQISTALALAGLFEMENAYSGAVVAGAMSVDAFEGSDTPFDMRIHNARGQVGQIDVATIYRRLLAGSEIRNSHLGCAMVQDPYSLRCQPQVMGAILDMMRFAANSLVIEAQAATDNPLVFPEMGGGSGEVLSGGNFHAEPVAMAADVLAIAMCEIGTMSERRTALLMDSHLSRLPPFLVNEPGLNSGFMMAHVTAAALASENKHRANPTSTDTIPTSANQEDHVSMATHGARRLLGMAENAAGIVAIELMSAAQGIDFQQPNKTSTKLQVALELIRGKVPFYDKDRPLTPDIEDIRSLVKQGVFNKFLEEILPSYHGEQG